MAARSQIERELSSLQATQRLVRQETTAGNHRACRRRDGKPFKVRPVSRDPDICLVLSDVDGTLLTCDKVLTDAAKAAVRDLRSAGIAFAIISGRPSRGMAMLIELLALRGAIAGFSSGVFVNPDLSFIKATRLTL